MMRNDYRRSLILLRSNASGYSGHVRLERRTLMGTMYFLVQSPGDCPVLRAALVGRGRDGSCYACALGELQQDARGQAVLGYSFDPRDICRRELEQYQLIAITCAGDESCQVVLFGNVCGHAELNWESVRAALCELYAGSQPPVEAQPQAEAQSQAEVQPQTEAQPQVEVQPQAEAQQQVEAQADGGAQSAQRSTPVTEMPEAASPIQEITPISENVTKYVTNVTGEAPVSEAPEAAVSTEAPRESAVCPDARPDDGEAQPEAIGIAAVQPEAVLESVGEPAAAQPETARSGVAASEAGEDLACDLLEAQGVRTSAPWPGAAEALRALFRSEPALTDAPDGQCVYVEAPMPEGSGFPFVAAGLLALNGAPVAIRYALPAAWSEEPPAGLEDCAWVGDQNAGWWVTEVPLDS